jgi:hypothetical protein
MAVAAEHQIILALKSAMEDITTLNGYETEVRQVLLYDKGEGDVPVHPSILMATLGTTDDQTRFSNKNEVTLNILMRLTLETYTEEHQAIANFVADVRKRLFSEGNIFLGGLARRVAVLSTERYHTDEDDPYSGADVVLAILFRHTHADPYTPVP